MEIINSMLNQTIIMFLYILVGFFLAKKNIVSDDGAKSFGNVLIYIVIPSVVFKAFLTENTKETTTNLIYSFAVGGLALLLAMLISWVIFKKNPVHNFSSSFSNAGFMGIPIVSAVLGSEAVIYVTGMVALLNVLQFTYGQYIISKDKSTIKLKGLAKNPVIISLVLGILFYATQINLPKVLVSSIDGVSALNAPLAMFVLGFYLAKIKFSSIFTNAKVYLVSIVRLIIIPVCTLGLILLLNLDKTMALAILITSSAPVGSNIVVFCKKNGIDTSDGVCDVCQSTIFAVVILPLFVGISSMIL